jgi:hypothetical protein
MAGFATPTPFACTPSPVAGSDATGKSDEGAAPVGMIEMDSSGIFLSVMSWKRGSWTLTWVEAELAGPEVEDENVVGGRSSGVVVWWTVVGSAGGAGAAAGWGSVVDGAVAGAGSGLVFSEAPAAALGTISCAG